MKFKRIGRTQNRLNLRKTKRWLIKKRKHIALFVGVIVLSTSVTMVIYQKLNPVEKIVKIIHKDTSYASVLDGKPIAQALYAKETAFSTSQLPFDCYNICFGKTENYRTNIETLKIMKEYGEDYNAYLDRSKTYFDTLFNRSYRDIQRDPEKYQKEVVKLYGENGNLMANQGGEEHTSDVEAANLAQWYIDNKVTLSSSFTTDQSMIYEDGLTCWTRGLWTINPNADQKALDILNKVYGTKLKAGEKQYYVVELCYYIQHPDDVIGYTLLKQIIPTKK